MFALERQQQIARLIQEHGRVSVKELAPQFQVSEQTIRKDLLALEEARRAVRTHGGAIVVERTRPELGFEVRERFEPDAKRWIGAAAAEIVQDGESIALDASTTALQLARRLRQRGGWSGLTVITNGIRIAEELAGQPGITTLMPGGSVRWEALSVVGPWGDAFFKRINLQRAFLGAAGFTFEQGLTDATEEEAQIKRAMVANAREVTGIVDHTKFGRVAVATFCRVDRIDRLITDDPADRELLAGAARRGIEVIQGGEKGSVATDGAHRKSVVPAS